MNGLPDWAQMSVREQTEILKARMDTNASGYESLCKRVYAIEAAQGRTHYEGDGCAGGHVPPQKYIEPQCVSSGWEHVAPARRRRWERIEKAAMAMRENNSPLTRVRLFAALDS